MVYIKKNTKRMTAGFNESSGNHSILYYTTLKLMFSNIFQIGKFLTKYFTHFCYLL